MPMPIDVWLVSNGDYWKAAWADPTAKDGRRARSIGPKAKLSRRQANVLCRGIAAELAKTARAIGKVPKLFDWLTRYETTRSDVKASTRRTYRECFHYLRAQFPSDPPINLITRADAADWVDNMISGHLADVLNRQERDAARELGPDAKVRYVWKVPKLPTVRRHVRTAKMVFQKAAEEDRIPFNPFDRLVGSPPKPLRKWREVTRDELTKQILPACPNESWRMLFALCRFNALRLNEALTLEWSHVDWSGNRIRVNESIEAETTKQRMRVCPIEPARCPTGMTALMQTALAAAPDGARFVCEGVKFNNLRRMALAILKRSGVGIYAKPFHTLRKCRISELALEYPQGVLTDWVGHDEEVSRRHYQRVPEELYALPGVANAVSKDTVESS